METFFSISPVNHGWTYGYGFFSNYRICLEQLIDHHEKGTVGIPYIDWNKTTWIEGFNPFESKIFEASYNPFDLWFEQKIPSESDSIIVCKHGPRPDIIDHAKDYFDEPIQLERQREVENFYIKPKKYITDKVDEIYEKEFNNEVVLGVMARGSEYNLHHPMYGVFTIDDYIREIKHIMSENTEITKVFIVSDESEYVRKISENFPNSYFVPNVFRRTDETDEYINKVHCWMNVSTKRENHCKLLGEETIIQTKLLGKCDYLFGRHCGIFSGAVLWGEKIKKIYKIKK